MSQCKSKYGFYYFCPTYGRTFESSGQQRYNSEKYKSRFDYANNMIINSNNTKLDKMSKTISPINNPLLFELNVAFKNIYNYNVKNC